MKPFRLATCALVLGIAAMMPIHGAAQDSPPQTPPPAGRTGAPPPAPPPAVTGIPAPPEAPEPPDDFEGRSVVRIGQDYALSANESIRDMVVIMGNATIDGHVDQDVVVILGTLQLASTAVVEHDMVVVGGGVRIAPGARVGHDFVVVGGSSDIPPEFTPGGEHIVIGSGLLGLQFERVMPWLTRGLLWGRPIVPELLWMWGFIAAFFFLYLVLNQIARVPVASTTAVLTEKPLTAFGAGLLVLLLLGPVCLLLAVSVIGLAVVPFVFCALLIAALIGKVAVMRWLGDTVLRDNLADTGMRDVVTFVTGFVILLVSYMIPVLGFPAWAIASVVGLGGASLAFVSAYRREQPPAIPAGASVPPPPVPTTYQPQPGTSQYTATHGEISAAPATDAHATGAIPAGMPIASAVPLPRPSDLLLMPRAAFRDRLAAVALDFILVVIVVQMFDVDGFVRAIFLGMLLYNVGFWTWKQTTVGGMICQLRVVRVNGMPITFADALVRGLSSIFSAAVVGLGFLWILRDPDQQAWHDKIAGTYVVKVPRNWPM